MPKLKTNKGTIKRLIKTGKGRLKHRSSNRAHINTKMTRKRKRKLRKMSLLSKKDLPNIKKQIPYC